MRYFNVIKLLSYSIGFLWVFTAYPVASVDLTDKGGAVGPTAFGGNNKFYVGSKTAAAANTFALSRIELERKDGAWGIKVPVAMAPATNADLSGKAVTHIAVGKDGNPVVAVDGDGSHVQVVTSADGTTVVKNAAPIKDSTGTAAGKIHSLVATKNAVKYGATDADGDKTPLIFATVSSNAAWNAATGRGVSMINQTTGAPFDAANFANTGATNKAAAISVATGGLASGADATFEATAAVDTCWSEPQKLLYVALSGLKTGGADGNAAVGLAVGKITPATVSFALEPVVPPAIFNTADTKGNKTYIVGAATSGATSGIIDLFKVRTMHTSTGKDYVIVNGGVRIDPDSVADDARAWVFALPVNADTGKLLKNDFSGDAAGAEDLLSVERGAPISEAFQRASVGVSAGYLTSVATSETLAADGIVAANAVGVKTLGGGSMLLADSILEPNSALAKSTTIEGTVELNGGIVPIVKAGTAFGQGTILSAGITLPAKMVLTQDSLFSGPTSYVFNLKYGDGDATFSNIVKNAEDIMTVNLSGGFKLTQGSVIYGKLSEIQTVSPDDTKSFILPAGTRLGKGTRLVQGSVFKNNSTIDITETDLVYDGSGASVRIGKRTTKTINKDAVVNADAGALIRATTMVAVAPGSIFKNVVLGVDGSIDIAADSTGFLQLGEGSICQAGTAFGGSIHFDADVKLRAVFALTKSAVLSQDSKLPRDTVLNILPTATITLSGLTTWGGGLFNPGGAVTLGGTMVLASGSNIANGSKIVVGSIIRNNRSFNQITITDMQIIGDTVFVSLAEKRDHDPSADTGVFASTALFDSDGFIKDWTPWQRISKPDAVKGFGFDEQSSNLWYVTTADETQDPATLPLKDYTKAKVMTWGQGNVIDPVVDGKQILNSNFSAQNLGMVNVVDFSDETVGFKHSDTGSWPYFSMRVSVGYGQVVLIQTGTRDANRVFQPTTELTKDTNTFVFDENNDASKDVLPKLGLITCAELSRMVVPDSGWLFVGGTGGVAVLTKTDGTGFDGNAGLEKFSKATDNSFPGGSKWKFVQLVDVNGKALFPDVRKFVAVGVGIGTHWLYILTRTALYRLEMKKENFIDGKIASASVQTIASISDSTSDETSKLFTSGDEFYDMMVMMRKPNKTTPANSTTEILLATSSGLCATREDILKDDPTLNVKNVPLNLNTSIGIPLHFDFISSTYGDNLIKFGNYYGVRGNLYVTSLEPDISATDTRTTIKACVYRLCIIGAKISLIAEPYGTPYFYSLGTVNIGAFESNGQIDFMALSRHVGNLFIEKLSMLPDSSNFTKTTALDLGQSVSGLHFGSVRRNLANGSLCVPFQNGLSVNE